MCCTWARGAGAWLDTLWGQETGGGATEGLHVWVGVQGAGMAWPCPDPLLGPLTRARVGLSSIQRSSGMVTIMAGRVWEKGEERQVSLGPSHPVSAWDYKYSP